MLKSKIPNLLRAITIISASTISTLSHATIVVQPMVATLNAEVDGFSEFHITSKSTENQFIKIQVKKINSPGLQDETEEILSPMDESNLIASPQKILLPPGSTKVVRVISQNSPASETVYRVYFEPVSIEEPESIEIKKDLKLKLNVTWAPLIRVLPQNQIIKLSINKADSTLLNQGSIRLGITDLYVCSNTQLKGDRDCTNIPMKKSIYPGQSIPAPKLKTSEHLKIKYLKSDNGEESELIISS